MVAKLCVGRLRQLPHWHSKNDRKNEWTASNELGLLALASAIAVRHSKNVERLDGIELGLIPAFAVVVRKKEQPRRPAAACQS